MKIIGRFEVLKKLDRYVIVYIEKGEQLDLSELNIVYSFDNYDEASQYIKNNKDSLKNVVIQYKEAVQREIEERIALERAQEEAARIKMEEKAQKKAERKEKRRGFWYSAKGIVAAIVATALTLTGGHFLAVGISNLVEKDKRNTTSQSGNVDPTKDAQNTTINNSVVNNNINISNDVENIATVEEELNQENFENLVATFAKTYVDKKVNISTEDLTKFVSIVNIDKLAEENPEFAATLFSVQTKEEYLNDAAKVIGATYSYNYMIFEKENSTENFIRISDSIYGSQKEKMLIIEEYVDLIAKARGNETEVNKIVSELLVRMHCEDLTYLDDGVGFGMQVYVELIRSYLAKDELTQENFDLLTTMTSSDEYVSNIFTVYDKCLGVDASVKTK